MLVELEEIGHSDTARLAEVTLSGNRPPLVMATCLEQTEPAFYAWWQIVNKPNSEILRKLANLHANLNQYERPEVLFPPQAKAAESKHGIGFMQVEIEGDSFRVADSEGRIGSRLEASLLRNGRTQAIDRGPYMLASSPFTEVLVTNEGNRPTRTVRVLSFYRLQHEIAGLYAETADVRLGPAEKRQLGNTLSNFGDENFSRNGKRKLKLPVFK